MNHRQTGRFIVVIDTLAAGEDYELAPAAIILSPWGRDSGISVQPYVSSGDGGFLNAIASLKRVAGVLLRVRDALPQLSSAAATTNAAEHLVAYIYFDSSETDGLDLSTLAELFGEVLHWNPRLCLVIGDSLDDHFYFGRDATENMMASTTFTGWASRLGA